MNCSILIIWLQYVSEQDVKTEILKENYYKRNKLQCVLIIQLKFTNLNQARFKDSGFSGEVLGDKGETGHLPSQSGQVHLIISPLRPLKMLLVFLLLYLPSSIFYILSCSYIDGYNLGNLSW